MIVFELTGESLGISNTPVVLPMVIRESNQIGVQSDSGLGLIGQF